MLLQISQLLPNLIWQIKFLNISMEAMLQYKHLMLLQFYTDVPLNFY